MQKRAARNHPQFFRLKSHGLCESDGIGGHSLEVAFGLFVAQIERIAHGLERNVVTSFKVLHGRTQAAGPGGDDRFKILPVDRVLLAQASVLDGAHDDVLQLRAFKGFQIRVSDDMKVIDRGEHNHRHTGIIGADLVEQGKAVRSGHHDVGEHEVVVGVLLEPGCGLFLRFPLWLQRSRCVQARRL